MEAGEDQVRGRRADVDPDGDQLDVVELPERLVDGVRLGSAAVAFPVVVRKVDRPEVEVVVVVRPVARQLERPLLHRATPASTSSIFGWWPYLASSCSKIRWMRGSWSSYSIWRPPSLTLTSIPRKVFFLSSLNG